MSALAANVLSSYSHDDDHDQRRHYLVGFQRFVHVSADLVTL